jgi:hypothetical protein
VKWLVGENERSRSSIDEIAVGEMEIGKCHDMWASIQKYSTRPFYIEALPLCSIRHLYY